MPSNSETDEHYKLLVEHEEHILNSEKSIKNALDENLNNSREIWVNMNTVTSSIEIALYPEMKDTDEELRSRLAHIIPAVISSSGQVGQKLDKAGASKELIRIFIELANSYGAEAGDVVYRENQGDDYWYSLSGEVCTRGTEEDSIVGINYIINLAQRDRVRLSVDMGSNLSLVRALLSEQNKALTEFGQKATNQINQELLDSVREELDKMENKINQTGD